MHGHREQFHRCSWALCCGAAAYQDCFAAPVLLPALDTMPLASTNDPGPTSMSPVPKCSTLAKRRGNAGKSTAKMAVQVHSINTPL